MQRPLTDLGQLGCWAVGHAQPVGQVFAEVVAEEGSHGKGVVHDDRSSFCSSYYSGSQHRQLMAHHLKGSETSEDGRHPSERV